MKILLIRLDKIGDLVCSLPVDQSDVLQNHECVWALSKGLSFLPENAVPRRIFIELARKFSWPQFVLFFQFLRKNNFEMAISFQAPWWIHFGLWLFKVPQRIGVRSQWHSYLFLNKSLRQKRSLSQMHEADYNHQLVHFAFDQEWQPRSNQESTPVLRLAAPNFGILARYKLEEKKYFVVHPGMAGSALNWSIKNYISLIQDWVQTSKVVVTGTAADEGWLSEIKSTFENHENFLCLQNKLNAHELLDLLSHARHVLAPSTGVLHLAASLGTPCTGIYSPIQVQAPVRWRARSVIPESIQILSPQFPEGKKCPVQFECLGEKCAYFYCLDQISKTDVKLL